MKKLLLLVIFMFLMGCAKEKDPQVEEPIKYTIEFETNSSLSLEPITFVALTEVVLPVISKEGYLFNGWADDKGALLSTTVVLTKNLKLTARWSLASFEVRFVDMFDQLILAKQVFYKQSVTPPEAPALDDYVFFKWDTSLEQITRNTTVKATYLQSTSGLVFDRIDDGYQVIDYKGSASEVIIPAYFNGLPVSEIGPHSFEDKLFTSITLPETLKHIRDYAFNRVSNLATIEFPSSLESIGSYAFAGCTSLASLTIPSAIIGERAFENNFGLKEVILLDTVTTIKNGAFFNCSSLLTIMIPSSVSTIESHFVSWCQRLSTIYTNEENTARLQSLISNIEIIYSNKYTIQAK